MEYTTPTPGEVSMLLKATPVCLILILFTEQWHVRREQNRAQEKKKRYAKNFPIIDNITFWDIFYLFHDFPSGSVYLHSCIPTYLIPENIFVPVEDNIILLPWFLNVSCTCYWIAHSTKFLHKHSPRQNWTINSWNMEVLQNFIHFSW